MNASRVLFNLFDSELFAIRSFDAKQLQRAVMKLILSFPVTERYFDVCNKVIHH